MKRAGTKSRSFVPRQKEDPGYQIKGASGSLKILRYIRILALYANYITFTKEEVNF